MAGVTRESSPFFSVAFNMASSHHAGASTLGPHAPPTPILDEKEVVSKLETTSYERPASDFDALDIFTYHERNAGRLVVDPE